MEAIDVQGVLQGLVLLVLANGAPVIARNFLGQIGVFPLDAGYLFADGRPWFGPSKTWRGVIAALIVTTLAGVALGIGWGMGAAFGGLAMVGDLVASFTKRRLGIPSSSRVWGLDQIPEALLPMAVLHEPLGLAWAEIVLVVLGFILLDWLISPWLYRLHIRRRPY